jgi:predicted Co/Zn/Cd cation transporter (cation efflux family)
MASEQTVLKRSILATILVGSIGIGFGVLSGSLSIVFDGVFSAVDASMTALALVVSRLIARQTSRRFQMGFWHIEPMVLAVNGSLLIALSFYAFVNAVSGLLSGGRELEFGWAIVYAAVVAAICLAMFLTGRRANRAIGSELVALDVKGWAMSGLITTALLVAFALAALLEGTPYEWMMPYVDPAVLAILTLVIIPVPVRTVWSAIGDIFLVAPSALDEEARSAAGKAAERYGFAGFRTYVAKVGRSRLIEVHFLVPADFPIASVETLDAIRAEVAAGIGGRPEDRWLTIAFTGDPRWAD